MRLKTEEIITARKILFVCKKKDSLVTKLESTMGSYNFDIFTTTEIPEVTRQFTYIFIFDDTEITNKLLSVSLQDKTKIILILYNKKKELLRYRNALNRTDKKNIKVINIDPESADLESIDTILWFLFSRSPEQTLDHERGVKVKKKLRRSTPSFSLHISKKKVIGIGMLLFFCFEFFFIVPYVATSFFLIKSARSLQSSNIASAQDDISVASPLLAITNTSYNVARPVFSFFYIALFTDDVMLLENKSHALLHRGIQTIENGKYLFPLMMNRSRTPLEQAQLINRVSLLKQQVDDLNTNTDVLTNKISNYTFKPLEKFAVKLGELKIVLDHIQKILSHIDLLIGGTNEKKYLVLFQNNMELRPGGGFIGSYGIITFQNYGLKDLRVEDVYDADGQLKAHIEPPYAIKTYMNQPHWFLRDSNFSPDFEKNFNQATYFLDKELGLKNFSGGAAITTTAIADLIDAFGTLDMPDYKETITKDNFYIKTQLQAESQFFPGSKQKKNFLSDLVTVIIDALNTTSPQKIGRSLQHALDEKQIVLYSTDPSTQKDFDSMGYGGKLAVPSCTTNSEKEQCIADTVFPVDANIGVNKANFFVSRLVTMSVTITPDGTIHHVVKTAFRNDSSLSIFPGGTYKNYYQIYVPQNSTITGVSIDGTITQDYQESIDDSFKTIGVLVEVLPQHTANVVVEYSLNEPLKTGNTLYQLVVQKQIGASNSDFILQLTLPKTVHLVSQNFSGLAKKTGLVYNTTLSNDRIFLIRLAKE